jgi:ABC-2 type transport system permease protein
VRSEFVVATKEFKDNLNSKRFLILFGLLTLLSIIGAISGISTYNSDLAEYNSNLQRADGSPTMGMRFMVDMPSILEIFNSYGTYIASFGMLLAISMGFDLISREKEEGTLKILLTHPVFRDQVINGKILGSVAMIIVVLLSTFLAIVAIMLFFGIVPSGDDVIRLAAFFLAVVLFLLAYLAIAIMSSTLSKSSSMAMLIAIAIVMVGMVIPNISSTVASTVLGEAPSAMVIGNATTGGSQNAQVYFQAAPNQTGGNRNATSGVGTPMQINPEYTSYYSKYNQITGILNMLSPSQDFTTIAEVINGRLASTATIGSTSGNMGFFQIDDSRSVSIWESLSSVWTNILALIVMIIAGFGISYARFIREDVR